MPLFPTEMTSDRLRYERLHPDEFDSFELYVHARDGAPGIEEITEYVSWNPYSHPKEAFDWVERCGRGFENGESATYFSDSPRRAYSSSFDSEMVIYRRRVSETIQLLTDVGFAVETIREPGYESPEKYGSEYGSFKPELMAKAPPTIVYSARKQ
jgi:hypothetical protein